VVHAGGHEQLAAAGAVDEQRAVLLDVLLDRDERLVERGGDARVAVRWGWLLVGDELGLHGDADVLVDGLHLVRDGRDRRWANDTSRVDRTRTCLPAGTPTPRARQGAGAQVQDPLVGLEVAVADVERLVVDEQPDELAVGHVDDGLAVSG
jgi:hypothetical protein